MNHSAQEILEITQIIKEKIEKKYSINLEHTIKRARYSQEEKVWIVTAVFDLFGEEDYFFYHISDKTGELIRTLDGYGYDSYLPENIQKKKRKTLKNGMNMKKNTQKILFKK